MKIKMLSLSLVFVLIFGLEFNVKARSAKQKSGAQNNSSFYKDFADDVLEIEKRIQNATPCKETEQMPKALCHYYSGKIRMNLIQKRQIHPRKHYPLVVEDFKAALDHDENYDGAGGFRSLSEFYLTLPRVPIWGQEWVRDTEKAWQYMAKALRMSPYHPENLHMAALIRLEQNDAGSALINAEEALKALKNYEASQRYKSELKKEISKTLNEAKARLKAKASSQNKKRQNKR